MESFSIIATCRHSGTLSATGDIQREKEFRGAPIVRLAERGGICPEPGTRAAGARGPMHGDEEVAANLWSDFPPPGIMDRYDVVPREKSSLRDDDFGFKSVGGQGGFNLLYQ